MDPCHILRPTDPSGTYLLRERDGRVELWAISDGEPEAEAWAPLTLGLVANMPELPAGQHDDSRQCESRLCEAVD